MEQTRETGNKREAKNSKSMPSSLFGIFHCYIKPSFLHPGLVPTSTSAPPSFCHWSAQPPPQSHKLPGCEPIQGERGSQHQPPGTTEVGDDPQSLRWTLAGLTHSSALIASAIRNCPTTSWAPHPPTSTTNACRVSSSPNLHIFCRQQSCVLTHCTWELATEFPLLFWMWRSIKKTELASTFEYRYTDGCWSECYLWEMWRRGCSAVQSVC